MFADLFYNLGALLLDLCLSVTARVIIQVLVKQWWMAGCCPQQCFWLLPFFTLSDCSLKSDPERWEKSCRGWIFSDCHCLNWIFVFCVCCYFGHFSIINHSIKKWMSQLLCSVVSCVVMTKTQICEKNIHDPILLLSMFFSAIYRQHEGM